MNKKLFLLVMTLMLVWPVVVFASSKANKGKNLIAETPIEAPMNSVFDTCGPPHNPPPFADLTPKGPYKIFDDVYYVGTKSVGSFVLKTSEGLILLDAGWGAQDCGTMMRDLQALGLNPTDIKLILVSHEHIDHYGCVKEWKDTVCPSAQIAMSQLGWNYLRTWPLEAAYDNPRPDSIDMYLTDGQQVNLGNTTIKIVATPGHSPGCVSFIFDVMDRGEKHVVGIMGGTRVPKNWGEALLYYTSVEYFKQKCVEEGCDVGLGVHAEKHFTAFETLANRKTDEPNPLVIGTERFVTEYIEMYKDMADKRYNGDPKGKRPYPPLQPEHFGKPRKCPDTK